MIAEKFRLITKGDFDGVTCGILLNHLGLIDRTVFVHPKDVESGKFAVTSGDITAGLPYKADVHMAFDHFSSASARDAENLKVDAGALSVASVIYKHYGKDRFFSTHEDLLEAVDMGSSGKIATEDILYPTGWVLLGYLLDPRTGLEEYKKFRKSHDELMNHLIHECGHRSIWEILDLPDIEERLDLYFSCTEDHKAQILRCSSVLSNLIVTDTRAEKVVYPGNKFVTYALFPECDVSLNVASSSDGRRTVFAAGKSVLDRHCSLDVGGVMKKYGGGGHAGAGGCQVASAKADECKADLIKELQYGTFKNLLQGYFNYY